MEFRYPSECCVRLVLAPLLVRRSPLGLGRHRLTRRVFARVGCLCPRKRKHQLPPMGLRAPSESSRLRAAVRRHCRVLPRQQDDANSSSHEVLSPTAFPRTEQRPRVVCFTSAHRLRPQVFSTSRRFESAPCLLALFHARSAHGVSPFRALLPSQSRSPSPAPLPS
jgi:hypothetical protein